jgi:hypothetical protein
VSGAGRRYQRFADERAGLAIMGDDKTDGLVGPAIQSSHHQGIV